MTEKMRVALEAAADILTKILDDVVAYDDTEIGEARKLIEEALAEPTEVESIPKLKGEITVLHQRIAELEEGQKNHTIELNESEKRGFERGITASPSADQVQRWISEAYEEGKEYQRGETAVNILSLPQQIKEQHQKVANQTVDIEATRKSIKEIELLTMLAITGEVTTEGTKVKPKFSNAEAREAELQSRVKDNNGYASLVKKLADDQKQAITDQIQLEYLNNLFIANCEIAEMR